MDNPSNPKSYLWDNSSITDFVKYFLPFDEEEKNLKWFIHSFQKNASTPQEAPSFFLQENVLEELEKFWEKRKNKKKLSVEWEKATAENLEKVLSGLCKLEKKKNENGTIVESWKVKKEVNFLKNKLVIYSNEHKQIFEKWVSEKGKENLEKNEKLTGDLKKRVGEEADKELEKRADLQLIFYAREHRDFAIVTGEGTSENKKLFKKIPIICREEGIYCTDLTQFLKEARPDLHFTQRKF